MENCEKYERLASLAETLKYLLCDAIDTINALGCDLAKKSEKIIEEIERECEK